jgi:type IX secretion system PorP/SprF family membrane protein
MLVQAQDLHFSQFNENPSLINPALTGANGLRASINNKKQWKRVAAPFRTFGASFEMRNGSIKKKKEEADFGSKTKDTPKSFFAGGLSIYRDRAADGLMGLTQTNLSLAGFVPTGEKSYFSLGIQASYAIRKIETSSLLFPNQYVDGGYTSNISSGEEFGSQSFGYIDMAGGALWTFREEDRGLTHHSEKIIHVGAAVYHLTRPTQKYMLKDNVQLSMRYVVHADYLVSIPETRTAIMPSLLFQMQGSAMEIIAGGMFKYYMKNDTKYTGYVKRNAICGGVHYRSFDAVIISGLLEWQEQFALGLSYDLNVSKLSSASRFRGGVELTLRYTPPNSYLYQK